MSKSTDSAKASLILLVSRITSSVVSALFICVIAITGLWPVSLNSENARPETPEHLSVRNVVRNSLSTA